jgi:transcriptional regulator with XRE-family HTH domain
VLDKKEQDFFYKKLGELIRSARRRAKLNQQDVADFLDLKRTSIVNIEQGTQRIQLHSLIEIAGLLKMEPAELLVKLSVIIDKAASSEAEKKAITKVVAQLDEKEANSEILANFVKFAKHRT